MTIYTIIQQIIEQFGQESSYQVFIKPKQVASFDSLVQGYDYLYLQLVLGSRCCLHLLPEVLPTRSEKNIVIVLCPSNSIIEDQLKVLSERNVPDAVLRIEQETGRVKKLFHNSDDGEILDVPQIPVI